MSLHHLPRIDEEENFVYQTTKKTRSSSYPENNEVVKDDPASEVDSVKEDVSRPPGGQDGLQILLLQQKYVQENR